MARLFGTDGIRGIAGEAPLDADTVYRIGSALTEHLRVAGKSPRVLIGRDTRISGPWIEALLERAIADAGGTPQRCGVVSTPAVSLLTMRTGADAGVVISASHNPYQDNGIKIFASSGMKFSDAVEDALEARIAQSRRAAPASLRSPEGAAVRPLLETVEDFRDLYRRYLHETLERGTRLEGMRLVVDCGHGALSTLAPAFFRELGADVEALHCEPDGRNINRDSGALHLGRLCEEVRRRQAHVGVAFDGDADRAMLVDSAGRVHDGDDVLYLLASRLDAAGAPRVIVGTIMANLGLELALQKIGFELVRTAVGDRYVLEEMLRLGSVLGGEQSGHVILLRLSRTGDGLLTALKVLEASRAAGRDIAELCAPVARLPQVTLNVPVRDKVPLADVPGLAETERLCRELLGPRSRIVLRYSGTEKLARVMVEGEEQQAVDDAARRLADVFARLDGPRKESDAKDLGA